MKNLLKFSALALFVAVGAFVLTSFNPSVAAAQDDEQPVETTQEQTTEENTATYTYTAQPGDSYTKIARKAVQTFGVIKNVNLTQAQIIAAETFLTQEAGSPELNQGQEIKVTEASIDAAVKKAQALDAAALSRWEKYVKYADFNTNNVGEAR